MTEKKKIVIPEAMKEAVSKVMRARWDYREDALPASDPTWENYWIALEAALHWWTENGPPLMKRFDFNPHDGEGGMEESIDGDYLRYSDVCHMFLAPEPELDPLVMYIMRHFDDIGLDEQGRRNRAEAAIADYKEHVKRNAKTEKLDLFSDEFRKGSMGPATPEPKADFDKVWNDLTVEINRVGIKKATEILRAKSVPDGPYPEFMECETCRAKPGSPYLCSGCLHNRNIINDYRKWLG